MASKTNDMKAISIHTYDSFVKFQAFCSLPRKIYSEALGFSAPLDLERWTLHSKQLNPHFKRVDSQGWLARKDGKWVGRIFAQVYKEGDTPVGASRAQFGCLDTIDDGAVVQSLLTSAEDWLHGRGADVIHGPYSPSVNSESGLLIEGFKAEPMILMPWNPPYLKDHLERLGYWKAKDLISYRYDVSEKDRQSAPSILERPEWSDRLKVRTIDLTNLESEIALIVELFNDAWSENWGFVPFTIDELRSEALFLKHVMPAEGGFIIELDGDAQAFGLVLPNIFELTAGLKGRLFPLGLAKLLWRLKHHRYESGLLGLFGVRKALQRKAIGGAVILAFIEECRRRSRMTSIKRVEFGWILEDNMGMRRPIEMAGGQIHTVRRIYGKKLAEYKMAIADMV